WPSVGFWITVSDSSLGAPVRLCKLVVVAVLAVSPLTAQQPGRGGPGPRFEIGVRAELRNTPVTGGVYVFVSRRDDEVPRLQVHHESDCTPFFGVDVRALAAGGVAVVNGTSLVV